MRFKYNIGHYISLLPDHIYPDDVVNSLMQHGISKAQYLHDKNIEEGSDKEIPDERLTIYSKVLGISVERLKNS